MLGTVLRTRPFLWLFQTGEVSTDLDTKRFYGRKEELGENHKAQACESCRGRRTFHIKSGMFTG